MNGGQGIQTTEEALEEIDTLLKDGNTDEMLLTAVRRILPVFATIASRLCDEIYYDDRFSVPLVLRCVARKVEESISAILVLVDTGHAYASMPLLRPMCEELIFAKFIKSLPRKEAEEYLHNKVLLEIAEGLKAQRKFFERMRHQFEGLSFESEIDGVDPAEIESRIANLREKLKDLRQRVGWEGKIAPTVAHMARSTESTDIYDFFYHGTSSAVHASLHHLARMIWGNKETRRFSISNRNFETYYSRFVLTYGVWLGAQALDAIIEEFPEAWPDEAEEAYNIWLAVLVVPSVEQGAPPIVTKEEVRW